MRFHKCDCGDVPYSTGSSFSPSQIPRWVRARREVDPHQELLKLHGLGVDKFMAVCLVRGRRVAGVFVEVPMSRKEGRGLSGQLAAAVAVVGDMARVLVEKAGIRLAGDTTGGDLLIEVQAVIGTRNGLPHLHGDLDVLTGFERTAAAQRFGLQ